MPVRVNMSDREAKARDFEPFRRGSYWCKVYDVEPTESQSEKNNGKPMYAFTFVVQDTDEYQGSYIRTNATLWDGALYTISAILKALGETEESLRGSFEIPDPEWFFGKDIIVRMGLGKPSKEKDEAGQPKYPARIEAKGFRAYKEGFHSQISPDGVASAATATSARSSSGEGSLLP